ncbi:MAG: TolC family protein [Candidatus Kapabacteria bacterium]|nr:TolC family protein [Candidatus Kapabacteria bacterium]MDW8012846.1 TolC family protein [Bacteroidota bacterium]
MVLCTLLLLGWLAVGAPAAQTPGSKPLSLGECLRLAFAKHPDLLTASAQLSATGAELTAAFGMYLPSLNFSAGYSRQLNVQGGRSVNIGGQVIRLPAVDPDAYSLSLTGSYILFDGFGREYTFQRAQSAVSAAEATLAYTRQRVAAEVIQLYMEALKAERLVAVRQQHYELGQRELERVRATVEVGRQPVTTLYAQEAEVAKREVELLQAKQQYELALARLRHLVGAELTDPIVLADPTLPDSLTPETARALRQQWGTFSELLQRALQNRQDYRAAQRRVEAARAAIAAARSQYFPTLTAAGGWSWANSALRDFGQLGRAFVGLQLTATLFDNFRTNAQLQAAEVQHVQAQAELEKLRQGIAQELQESLLTLEVIAQQLEAAYRSLRSATMYMENVRSRYELGAATSVELFAAEAQRTSAAATVVSLSYDFLAAQARVQYAVGLLEP